MIIPLSKDAFEEYSLIGDEGEQKTTFKLGYLNSRQKAAIAILTKKNAKETDESALYNFELVRFLLKGWTNFKMSDGSSFEYKSEKVNVPGMGEFEVMALSCFDVFKLEWVLEIGSKLYEMNYATPEQKKSGS